MKSDIEEIDAVFTYLSKIESAFNNLEIASPVLMGKFKFSKEKADAMIQEYLESEWS